MGQDGEPCQHSPQTILLPDVIAACAEGLFAADGALAGVHEIAKELPAGGYFVTCDALGLGNAVQGSGGGHAAGDPLHSALEVRDGLRRVRRDNRHTVAGSHKELAAQDHVAVGITVAGGAQVGHMARDGGPQPHHVHQVPCIGQVGVRVVAPEVRQGLAVNQCGRRHAQLTPQDAVRVRARHPAQAVEGEAEVGPCQESLDGGEVEDGAQQL
mmetsp:Transcript_8825/g.26427  ORF Transcript_8825/g.26427 Transcript_8825/m.26427 type:complete len:213 (-) Transcript_8825:745-1383(-)